MYRGRLRGSPPEAISVHPHLPRVSRNGQITTFVCSRYPALSAISAISAGSPGSRGSRMAHGWLTDGISLHPHLPRVTRLSRLSLGRVSRDRIRISTAIKIYPSLTHHSYLIWIQSLVRIPAGRL